MRLLVRFQAVTARVTIAQRQRDERSDDQALGIAIPGDGVLLLPDPNELLSSFCREDGQQVPRFEPAP